MIPSGPGIAAQAAPASARTRTSAQSARACAEGRRGTCGILRPPRVVDSSRLLRERTRLVAEPELTYCVVNTSQRELLLRDLDAIARERAALPFDTEVLVLDNGSRDGSAQAAREHPAVDETIAVEERR